MMLIIDNMQHSAAVLLCRLGGYCEMARQDMGVYSQQVICSFLTWCNYPDCGAYQDVAVTSCPHDCALACASSCSIVVDVLGQVIAGTLAAPRTK